MNAIPPWRIPPPALYASKKDYECAVDAGASVELIRRSRDHDGRGKWDGQMVPTIRKGKKEG